MIDREQVTHVARLARLKLSDEEAERMQRELSGVLEHVEKISELVVAVTNVLRPDEPRASWDRDQLLEGAPDSDSGAYRVPSPQA